MTSPTAPVAPTIAMFFKPIFFSISIVNEPLEGTTP
jgi:hypothetical protein